MATDDSSFITQCQYVENEDEEECQEEQYSICPCCNMWLCSPHLQEHQQIVQSDAHAVNDHANQVRQQLTELSVDYLYEHCKKKIDEWKDQMYVEINARHAEMLQQLSKLHNELTEEVTEFKTKTIESFTHQFVEPLTHMLTKQKQVHPQRLKTIETQLQTLESKIEDIKKCDLIHINCDEIKLNGEIKFIRQHPCDEMKITLETGKSLELEAVKQKAIHQFPLKTTEAALAASTHFILAYGDSSTLHLFDAKNRLRSFSTENNDVFDICWSNTMRLFLIVGSKFQTYDIISNKLVETLIDTSRNKRNIWCVTYYVHDILLLYGNGDIVRYSWPSFTLKTKWSKGEYLGNDSDSGASHIRINDIGVLAMTIKQKDLHWRIDLFDAQMYRTHRGISLTNNGNADLLDFPLISLANNEWLVMDVCSQPPMLLLIDEKGNLKQQIDKNGSNIALMNKELLVLRDGTGLYLYKLS